jgi:hypothetical protein
VTSTARTKSPATARPVSHLAGALVDITLLVLINVSPGWRAVPVLTEEAADVVVAVDITLAVALVVNLFCLIRPRRLATAAGDVISTAAGLAALIRTIQVFPFAFTSSTTDWTTVARMTLISIVVVVSIALLVQVVVLVRLFVTRS